MSPGGNPCILGTFLSSEQKTTLKVPPEWRPAACPAVVSEALSLSTSPASLLTLSSVRLPQMREAGKESAKEEREVIETSREGHTAFLAVGRRPTELCGVESRIRDHCWGLPHAHHWHHPSCH